MERQRRELAYLRKQRHQQRGHSAAPPGIHLSATTNTFNPSQPLSQSLYHPVTTSVEAIPPLKFNAGVPASNSMHVR